MTAISWRVIHSLYGGLIGKALFLIGLVIPMAKLTDMGFNFENYSYYLIGSILILVGFIVVRVFIPSIIVEFNTPQSYANSVLDRSRSDSFDYRIEFNGIDEFQEKDKLLKIAGFPNTYISHFPASNAVGILGKGVFSYYFGLLNYAAIDNASPVVRSITAILFLCGAFCIYRPILLAIIKYFGAA